MALKGVDYVQCYNNIPIDRKNGVITADKINGEAVWVIDPAKLPELPTHKHYGQTEIAKRYCKNIPQIHKVTSKYSPKSTQKVSEKYYMVDDWKLK